MQGHIPEAFRQVSLQDRWTWHRATLKEWLALRAHLLEKQRAFGDPHDWASRRLHAQFAVARRLSDEMGTRTTSPHPPIGGDVAERREQLMKEEFFDRYPEYDPLTEWEKAFLETSQWLEDVLIAYRERTRVKSPLQQLFEWIRLLEDEEGLADRREQARRRNRDAVVQTSERRLKSNRNPFLPRPLELVFIDAAATIIVANIQREFETFVVFGEPVPGTESRDAFQRREFLRQPSWSRSLAEFVDELRRLGYFLLRDEQECISWPGWTTCFHENPRATARQFLAYLFDAKTSTIARYVSRSKLIQHYMRAEVAEDCRVFVEKGDVREAVTTLRVGWVERTENGRPSRYDLGSTYELILNYREDSVI